MENPDTRVQFTKSRFQQAVVELLEEKSIGAVSVKELCDRAGLNRGTFYLHYSEPMDVLHELENRLVDKIMGDYFGGEDILTDRLRLMLSERKAYAAILGRHGDPAFLARACHLAYETVKPYFAAKETSAEEKVPEAFQFIFAGCTWIICDWLKASKPTPPEQLAKQLQLMAGGVYRATGNQTEGRRE